MSLLAQAAVRRLLPWLVLLCPLAARAQPVSGPALHWTRAENAQSCIDPRSLARQVEALTGRVLVPASEAELSIEATIVRRQRGGYRARIVATRAGREPRGQRVLEQQGDDCRALDAALALVIALFIDPDLSARGLPQELLALLPASEQAPEQKLLAELTQTPPAVAAAPPAPPSPRSVRAPAAEVEPRALAPRWALGLSGQVAGGRLPGIELGLTGDGAYRLTRRMAVQLWMQFGKGVPQQEIQAGHSVSLFVLSGSLMFCPWFARHPRWSSGACVGPELGWLRGEPSGFERGRSADLSVFAALLRLSVGHHLTQAIDVRVGGLLRVNLAERSLTYEGVGKQPEVYRVRKLGAGAELGMSYAF